MALAKSKAYFSWNSAQTLNQADSVKVESIETLPYVKLFLLIRELDEVESVSNPIVLTPLLETLAKGRNNKVTCFTRDNRNLQQYDRWNV